MEIVRTDIINELTVKLKRDIDYTEHDLIWDCLSGGKLRMINATKLDKIAVKNGYKRCNWSSFEHNNEVVAIFMKYAPLPLQS